MHFERHFNRSFRHSFPDALRTFLRQRCFRATNLAFSHALSTCVRIFLSHSGSAKLSRISNAILIAHSGIPFPTRCALSSAQRCFRAAKLTSSLALPTCMRISPSHSGSAESLHFERHFNRSFRHSFPAALRTFHRAKILPRSKVGILSRIVHMRENLSFSFGKCKTLSHLERHFNRSFRHSFPAAPRTFHRSGLCGLSCVAFAFAFIVAPHTLLQLSWPCRPPCARHRAAFYLLFFQYSSILLASKMAFDRIFVFRRVLFHHAK